MQWFKHDANANADAKLKRVRMKYGLSGYGLYWYCLELIAQTVDAHNFTFELEHDAELIAHDLNMSSEMVQEMMAYMVNLGLFEVGAGGRIYCMKMLKRMDASMTSNSHFRRQITKAKTQNHDGVMTESCSGHDGVMKKERKKERIGGGKRPESTKFTPPTLEQVQEYVTEKGYTFDPERFIAHNQATGWRLKGGQPIKCWKSVCTTWQKNQSKFGDAPSTTPEYAI